MSIKLFLLGLVFGEETVDASSFCSTSKSVIDSVELFVQSWNKELSSIPANNCTAAVDFLLASHYSVIESIKKIQSTSSLSSDYLPLNVLASISSLLSAQSHGNAVLSADHGSTCFSKFGGYQEIPNLNDCLLVTLKHMRNLMTREMHVLWLSIQDSTEDLHERLNSFLSVALKYLESDLSLMAKAVSEEDKTSSDAPPSTGRISTADFLESLIDSSPSSPASSQSSEMIPLLKNLFTINDGFVIADLTAGNGALADMVFTTLGINIQSYDLVNHIKFLTASKVSFLKTLVTNTDLCIIGDSVKEEHAISVYREIAGLYCNKYLILNKTNTELKQFIERHNIVYENDIFWILA
jgi:hypothetical protein